MSKKDKARPQGKVESIDEYLARGGSISRVPAAVLEPIPDVIKKSAVGPAVFLSLDEADLFYGEARKNAKPKKAKPALKIDLDALPPALRSKFIAKLKEEANGGGYEEEIDGIDGDTDGDE